MSFFQRRAPSRSALCSFPHGFHCCFFLLGVIVVVFFLFEWGECSTVDEYFLSSFHENSKVPMASSANASPSSLEDTWPKNALAMTGRKLMENEEESREDGRDNGVISTTRRGREAPQTSSPPESSVRRSVGLPTQADNADFLPYLAHRRPALHVRHIDFTETEQGEGVAFLSRTALSPPPSAGVVNQEEEHEGVPVPSLPIGELGTHSSEGFRSNGAPERATSHEHHAEAEKGVETIIPAASLLEEEVEAGQDLISLRPGTTEMHPLSTSSRKMSPSALASPFVLVSSYWNTVVRRVKETTSSVFQSSTSINVNVERQEIVFQRSGVAVVEIPLKKGEQLYTVTQQKEHHYDPAIPFSNCLHFSLAVALRSTPPPLSSLFSSPATTPDSNTTSSSMKETVLQEDIPEEGATYTKEKNFSNHAPFSPAPSATRTTGNGVPAPHWPPLSSIKKESPLTRSKDRKETAATTVKHQRAAHDKLSFDMNVSQEKQKDGEKIPSFSISTTKLTPTASPFYMTKNRAEQPIKTKEAIRETPSQDPLYPFLSPLGVDAVVEDHSSSTAPENVVETSSVWSSIALLIDNSIFCQTVPSVALRAPVGVEDETYYLVVKARKGLVYQGFIEGNPMEKEVNWAREEEEEEWEVEQGQGIEENYFAPSHFLVASRLGYPEAQMAFTSEVEQCELTVWIAKEKESFSRPMRYIFALVVPLIAVVLPFPFLLRYPTQLQDLAEDEFGNFIWSPPSLIQSWISSVVRKGGSILKRLYLAFLRRGVLWRRRYPLGTTEGISDGSLLIHLAHHGNSTSSMSSEEERNARNSSDPGSHVVVAHQTSAFRFPFSLLRWMPGGGKGREGGGGVGGGRSSSIGSGVQNAGSGSVESLTIVTVFPEMTKSENGTANMEEERRATRRTPTCLTADAFSPMAPTSHSFISPKKPFSPSSSLRKSGLGSPGEVGAGGLRSRQSGENANGPWEKYASLPDKVLEYDGSVGSVHGGGERRNKSKKGSSREEKRRKSRELKGERRPLQEELEKEETKKREEGEEAERREGHERLPNAGVHSVSAGSPGGIEEESKEREERWRHIAGVTLCRDTTKKRGEPQGTALVVTEEEGDQEEEVETGEPLYSSFYSSTPKQEASNDSFDRSCSLGGYRESDALLSPEARASASKRHHWKKVIAEVKGIPAAPPAALPPAVRYSGEWASVGSGNARPPPPSLLLAHALAASSGSSSPSHHFRSRSFSVGSSSSSCVVSEAQDLFSIPHSGEERFITPSSTLPSGVSPLHGVQPEVPHPPKREEKEEKVEETLSSTPIERVCRVCQDGEEEELLIAPCECTGTVRWIHRSCLDRWRLESVQRNPQHVTHCELCHKPFTVVIKRTTLLGKQISSIFQKLSFFLACIVVFVSFSISVRKPMGSYSCIAFYHTKLQNPVFSSDGLLLFLFLYIWCMYILFFAKLIVFSYFLNREDVRQYMDEMPMTAQPVSALFWTRRRIVLVSLVFTLLLLQSFAFGYLFKYFLFVTSQIPWSWEGAPFMGSCLLFLLKAGTLRLLVMVQEFIEERRRNGEGEQSVFSLLVSFFSFSRAGTEGDGPTEMATVEAFPLHTTTVAPPTSLSLSGASPEHGAALLPFTVPNVRGREGAGEEQSGATWSVSTRRASANTIPPAPPLRHLFADTNGGTLQGAGLHILEHDENDVDYTAHFQVPPEQRIIRAYEYCPPTRKREISL